MDWDDNEVLELAQQYMSNSNEKKHIYILKKLSKLSKKYHENDYTTTRDGAIMGLVLIGAFIQHIDEVDTTKKGREELLELKNEIIETFNSLKVEKI